MLSYTFRTGSRQCQEQFMRSNLPFYSVFLVQLSAFSKGWASRSLHHTTTTTTPPPPPSFRVLLHSMHGRDIRRFPSSRIMLMAAKYYWPAVRRLETSHPSTALLQHSRAHTFAHVRCSVTAAASFHHQQQPHAGHWCSWLLGV